MPETWLGNIERAAQRAATDYDLRTRIAKVLFALNAGEDWNMEPLVWEESTESYRECWFRQADAVIRELPELQQPVSISDYAAHLCQSGCDCSCCYGMDDCYHVTDPCNCGMDAKGHRHD